MTDQLQAPTALLPGGNSKYPLNRRLGGPTASLDVLQERKISRPLLQFEQNNDYKYVMKDHCITGVMNPTATQSVNRRHVMWTVKASCMVSVGRFSPENV
jgi:hypothetical protein